MIFINKVLKNISYLFQTKKSFGNPTIQQLEPTNACMMNCIMCPRSKMNRPIKFMHLNLFKKIIDQAKWNKELWLHHFGDPLIHPKIIDMINYVSDKGIQTKISVNPNLLTEEMCKKLVKSKLHTIMISLDGVNQETYQKLRGDNANYTDAVRKISNLLETKHIANSNLHITLSMIEMNINKDEIEDFRNIWEGQDMINEVSIKKFISWSENDESINQLRINKNKGKKYCSEPWFKVTVTADGKVVPCCYDYDKKLILGDLKEQPLEEIWNGDKMRELRKQIKSGKINNPLCKNCIDKINTSITRYNPFKIRWRHVKGLFS